VHLSEAVLDSDVLIKLEKRKLADKLVKFFATIHVPTAVSREVGLKGRRRHRPDVERFRRRALPCKKIDKTVFAAALVVFQRTNPAKQHIGEAQTIAQALRIGVSIVLTDDKAATDFAILKGLQVVSSFRLLRMIAETEKENGD